MPTAIRKLQSLWFSASVAASLCTATAPLKADPLIDYWAGELTRAKEGPTYHELRNEFFGKIENAKAAVNACGGCADAQEELDALLEEEEQFQSMASRALTMTGQPPGMFKFLGIRPPSFGDYAASFPTSYQMGEGIVDTNPDWLKDAPEFCQVPVRDHLAKLRTYQDRAQSIHIEMLTTPGGQYYEGSRVFRACFNKDYEEFARLEELRKARAAGQILPEIEPVGSFNRREKGMIYYGDVPDDFMPNMPPADIIKEAFSESEYRNVSFVSYKKKNDRLISASIFPFSGAWVPGRSLEGCRVAYAERSERAKRHCDDVNEIHRFKPLLLRCNYRTDGRFGVMGRQYELFWYDERVELAKSDYLLRRDQNHPLLTFLDARSSCPPTWQEVTAAQEAYQASLKRERGRVAEIPMNRALPRSEWMLERIEANRKAAERLRERAELTKAYDLPGYYEIEYEPVPRAKDLPPLRGAPPPRQRPGIPTIVWGDKPVSADCIIATDLSGLSNYQAACWTDSELTIGRARPGLGGIQLALAFIPTNQFLLDENEADTLRSERREGNFTLRRKRDLVRFGEYPLDGDYLLQLSFGGESLRAHCTFDSVNRNTALRLNCIDDQGRNFQSTGTVSIANAEAQMLSLRSVLHFPSWQAKYGGQRQGVTLGGYGVDSLFAVVDPAFEGESPRDARLLVLGNLGMTGSLQRIETGESAFGDNDLGNVTGHWVGDFQCGRNPGDMKAELYLNDEGKGQFREVSGTFVFRNTLYGDAHVLSHTVAGQYLRGVGSLKLEPGEWLKTVPQFGYENLGLRAAAVFPSDGGDARIQGDLTSKTCADLQLARVSRTVPETVVFEKADPEVAAAGKQPDTQAPAAAATAGTAKATSTGGAGPVIDLSGDTFVTGTLVPVKVTGLPGNSKDWVAISKAGQADNQYVSYNYTGGVAEGTWQLRSGPPGDYEVRVYLNWPAGGYNPVLRQPIKVVSPEAAADAGLISKPKVQLASRTFAPGQPIEVTVTGLPGNPQDWVAISKIGSADNKYQDYDYTYGVNEGTWTYTMGQPGDYEIRVYLNWPTGGYNPVVREKITVGGQR